MMILRANLTPLDLEIRSKCAIIRCDFKGIYYQNDSNFEEIMNAKLPIQPTVTIHRPYF
jgi:hypothetical protein